MPYKKTTWVAKSYFDDDNDDLRSQEANQKSIIDKSGPIRRTNRTIRRLAPTARFSLWLSQTAFKLCFKKKRKEVNNIRVIHTDWNRICGVAYVYRKAPFDITEPAYNPRGQYFNLPSSHCRWWQRGSHNAPPRWLLCTVFIIFSATHSPCGGTTIERTFSFELWIRLSCTLMCVGGLLRAIVVAHRNKP